VLVDFQSGAPDLALVPQQLQELAVTTAQVEDP
jgi:hypothetical protein